MDAFFNKWSAFQLEKKCAPLLPDIFHHSYKADFMAVHETKDTTDTFSLIFLDLRLKSDGQKSYDQTIRQKR